MRSFRQAWFVVVSLLVCPAAAHAQASIAGVVRDTSGGVLPGVTVEASSPALIERVRSVTTDGNGQYRIIDLAQSVLGARLLNRVDRDLQRPSGPTAQSITGRAPAGAPTTGATRSGTAG